MIFKKSIFHFGEKEFQPMHMETNCLKSLIMGCRPKFGFGSEALLTTRPADPSEYFQDPNTERHRMPMRP